jgi:pimeloyl-ACP methyl ester carboxylesterase
MRHRPALVTAAALLAASLAAGALGPAVAAAAAPAGRRELTVGTLRLRPCTDLRGAWCGRLRVPFDRADRDAGTIPIGFEWYPASGRAAGTIVAMEGGPGYPSTGSRDDYLELFAPLRRSRNLLLVDNRGTGTSAAVRCTPLQRWRVADGNPEYLRRVAACGHQLDHTRPLPGGGFVHGSDLYGTANAARDLADVLAALRTGRVDLYGDSYGSWFAQTFAARYPGLLRSVTLDATWPVLGTDPFYLSTPRTMRIAFDLACRRSVACSAAAPGRSMERIAALAERLRRAPVVGRTREPGGPPATWRVDIGALVSIVNYAGSDSGVYRDLDAAARAVLEHDDAAPLLRLAAQTIFTDDSGPVREFSAGLYVAVFCNDYPEPFDMRAAPATRRAQYAAAVAALPDDAFAPFTVHEWVTSPIEEFDTCLGWPSPLRHDPPIATSPPLVPPSLPVLVLSGGLDTLTTWTDGRLVAEHMGPSARWVKVENTAHVTALADPFGCASGLVRRFVAHPQRLHAMDVSCAARIPEVRAVGEFPERLAAVHPASPARGNVAGPTGLRLAAVGAAAVGDAIWRWWYLPGSEGTGLRGGRFTVRGDPVVRLRLRGVRFVADATVAGTATWDLDSGRVTARVRVEGPGGTAATLGMTWNDKGRHPRATVTGRAGGDRLAATLPAP